MSEKLRIILKSTALVSFSIMVLFAFKSYSVLRPITYGAPYKELMAGCIVLLLCFLNCFVLYPRLYMRRRFLFYARASFFSIIAATFLEVVLVYPHICDFISRINNVSPQKYFTVMTISLFMRDTCFVIFFLLINLLETANKENKDVNILLQNTREILLVRKEDEETKEKEMVTVRLSDIAFCQQNENYAYIHLADGTRMYRNCSLKSLYDQLTPSRVVRISRKVIVFYHHIVSYDNGSVYVNASNNDTPVGLKITDTFREQALQLLKKHCVFAKNQQEEPVPGITTADVVQTAYCPQQAEKDAAQEVCLPEADESQTAQQVLSFICEHPGCKNLDICDHFQFSRSTANRILKQLKDEGLIKHEGSKKMGGYSVVSS